MNILETSLPGVLLLEPKVFGDARGYFLESYNKTRYYDAGIREEFVQDNLSFSAKGVLRGLHFQNPVAQGKLVYVLQGEVFDVAVDIRKGSPHFGKWFGVVLSAENKKQLYIPPDYAHGFVVTSETALFAYKCTDLYSPATERVIIWNDPDIGISWPIQTPILANRDAAAPTLAVIDRAVLPEYANR